MIKQTRLRVLLKSMMKPALAVITLTALAATDVRPVGEDRLMNVSSSPSINVLQHNIDGAGEPANGGTAAVTDVLNQVTSLTDVLILQEVCEKQLNRLTNELPAYHFEVVLFRTNPNCALSGGSEAAYYVVASKHPLSNRVVGQMTITSGTPAGKTYPILCADVAKPGAQLTTACSTKFASPSVSSQERQIQAAELKAFMADRVQGSSTMNARPVVLAGDFNAKPNSPEMTDVYRIDLAGSPHDPNGDRGLFWEGDQNDPGPAGGPNYFASPYVESPVVCPNGYGLCRTGQFTHGPSGDRRRKFDYVFFSYPHFSGTSTSLLSQRVINSSTSMHSIISAVGTYK